MLRNSSFFF